MNKRWMLWLNGGLVLALCLALAPRPVQAVGGIIDVTTTEDEYNSNTDTCSLREAVQAANTGLPFNGCPAGDTIQLLGGETYVLTRTVDNEDLNATGDLDVRATLTLTTVGNERAIISGATSPVWADRLLDVPMADITVTVSSIVFINGNVQGQGGAVRNNANATLSLTSVVIESNKASTGGGGLANMTGGKTTLSQSIVKNNLVTGAGPAGAGILNLSNLTIIQSVIFDNTAQGGDGGGIATDGLVTLKNVTVSGNSAANEGGGLFIDLSGAANLNNVTITNNTADADADGQGNGGGIHVTTLKPTLSNTIVAGNFDNSPSGVVYPDCASAFIVAQTIISQGYNLVGNWTGSGTNCTMNAAPGDRLGTSSPLNAGLAPLGDNGSERFSHALLSSSPALNAGNPATPTGASFTCEVTDQRGIARTIGACDIGAFEARQLLYLPLIQR